MVIGAGAVGGTIAGRLARQGQDVIAVARGDHATALQRHGLRLRTPDFDEQIPLPTVRGPHEVSLRSDDVLILATKTHQAEAALSLWADAPVEDAPGTTAAAALPIFTALNGVASERMALRYFDRVFGVCLWLPAVHIRPGEVIARGTPNSGVLHLARYPAARATGSDQDLLARLAAHLRSAGFGAQRPADVMPWKYHKLLSNIENAFHALLGPDGGGEELIEAARCEAREVLHAAGITVTSDDEEAAVRDRTFQVGRIPGIADAQLGSSSWQSLARGTGSIETDYLNGEIALIAREHGSRAPLNAAVAAYARQAARTGQRPGQISAGELAQELGLGALTEVRSLGP